MTAVVPAPASASALAPPAVRARLAARLVNAAPDLGVSAVAGFSAPAIVLLLAGRYSPAWVLPFGLAGAAVAVTVCAAGAEHADRRTARYTLAALAIALAWLVVNSFFSAENLYAHRDPATYNLTGRWLMDHARLPIPFHPEIFGSPAGSVGRSAGFSLTTPTQLYAQGNHLLPALLAVAGWLFGTTALLKANVAFGAIALLAFFGLARRVVGAQLALVAMAAFAVSMPLIFVSRDTYSEPLALLFLIGGLGLLHRAVESGHVRDFALAGLVLGMTAPVRIDSYPSLLAVVVAATVLLGLAAPASRRHMTACVGALLGTALVPTVLGWLDVSQLASGYYHDERHHIMPAITLGFGLLAALPVVVAVAWRPVVRRRLASPTLHRYLTLGAGGLIVAAFAFLVTRPLWMVAHGQELPLVAYLQRRLGEPEDPTRSYTEQTVHWLAMYLGWPTVVLGAAGYVLLLRRMVRTRSLATVGMLAMGLGMSALYLMSSQITPDQPWAMRRFVPVVMPILLVAACYILCVLHRQVSVWLRAAGAVAALAMIAIPAIVTAPVASLREEVPQLAQVRRICDRIGPHGAVLELDPPARTSYGQTIRSYCDVPSLGLDGAQPAQLARVRSAVADHGRVLYVLATKAEAIPFAAGTAPSAPFSVVRTTRWPSVLHGVPAGADHEQVAVYLASVRADGLAEPVTASR